MSNYGSLSDLQKREEEAKDDKKTPDNYTGSASRYAESGRNPDVEDWQRIEGQAQSSPPPAGSANIALYRNGFTVNGGPFRPTSNPINKKFVDEVVRGICPAEVAGDSDEPVSVSLEDRRQQEYKAPAAAAAAAPAAVAAPSAFSGSGNTLGGASSSSAAAPVQADSASITVDPSKPKTQIQIRFHDGQRKAQEFNETHTVGDLRNFVQQCVGGQTMQILGGFPPRPVTNDSQTLQDSGLSGSAITVKPA